MAVASLKGLLSPLKTLRARLRQPLKVHRFGAGDDRPTIVRVQRCFQQKRVERGALLENASTALEPSYGGDPAGAMAFVRLKVG
jgi:hypothetical protein